MTAGELEGRTLSWRDGAGWLVLIGGTSGRWEATALIDEAAVERMPREGPVAFLPTAACPPDYAESFLRAYASLGARHGYAVPIHDRRTADEPSNAGLLEQASLIYFGGGETTHLLAAMTDSRALNAVAMAYERGAVVVGMSAGAIALAERGLSLSAGVLEGWGWAERLLVSVHHGPSRHEEFSEAMRDYAGLLAAGIPEETALALGPHGEVEVWGTGEVVVEGGGAT
jgi:cyanophycinase